MIISQSKPVLLLYTFEKLVLFSNVSYRARRRYDRLSINVNVFGILTCHCRKEKKIRLF